MTDLFRLSPEAQADLQRIVDEGKGKWSTERTDAYLAEIQSAVETLGTFPSMGLVQKTLEGNVRTFFVGSHVVVYTGAEPIEVLRIPHQSSDWLEISDTGP